MNKFVRKGHNVSIAIIHDAEFLFSFEKTDEQQEEAANLFMLCYGQVMWMMLLLDCLLYNLRLNYKIKNNYLF